MKFLAHFYCKHPVFPKYCPDEYTAKKVYSNPIMFHNGPVNNTWHYLFNDTVDLLKILNKNFKCRLILNVGWAYLNHIQYSFMIHNLTFIFLKKIQMYQFDCESIIIFIYRWRHCDQHLCAWLLTLVTRRHVTVTWLWRGHGDSVTARGAIRHNQEEFLRSIK